MHWQNATNRGQCAAPEPLSCVGEQQWKACMPAVPVAAYALQLFAISSFALKARVYLSSNITREFGTAALTIRLRGS